MATSEIFHSSGVQFCLCDTGGDFGPTSAANDLRVGTPTLVQMALASLANDAARQSAKVDLGADRVDEYSVMAALELASAGLTAGNTLDFYWAHSPSSTAANANPAGISGSDSAYTGYSSNLDDSLLQLTHVGSFTVTGDATTTVQIDHVGKFSPREQYGSLVVVNRSGAALHTDDIEMHVVITPVTTEVHNAT